MHSFDDTYVTRARTHARSPFRGTLYVMLFEFQSRRECVMEKQGDVYL
jgi:hypothetical protein